jgi:hypothetical protein
MEFNRNFTYDHFRYFQNALQLYCTLISGCPSTSDTFGSSVEHFNKFSLFPVAPTLEHRASVKLFVSLQFFNLKTVGRAPWMGDQPFARSLPMQTQNKHRQTSMP